jgi:predicted RND superfamily exporter protein
MPLPTPRSSRLDRVPCGTPEAELDGALFSGICALAFAIAFAALIWRPQWFLARPQATLAALGAVTLVACVPLLRFAPLRLGLALDPSTEPLLPRGDPARAVYEEAVREFGDDEVFVVAMETDDVFRRERLLALRQVTDAIARLPEVRSVQSLTDVIAFRWEPEGEWIDVGRFLDEIPADPEALARLRERALADPLYRRVVVSDDGRTAAVNVTFHEMTDKEFLDARLEERIEAILASAQDGSVRFHVAGRPHLKHAVYHGMLRDLRVLVPAALGVLALVLFVCFGTRRSVVLPLGVVAVAIVWTYGAIAFLETPLSILTTMLGPMLIAVGSVYGVHVLGRYEEEAETAASPAAAALATLEHEKLPMLVSGFTTLVGFGANLITDVPAVFELGAFSLLGVAAMTLLSLLGIPALLALLPLRTAGSGNRLAAHIGAVLDRRLLALSAFVARHATPLIAGFALAGLASAALVPRIVIDTDYLSFFSPDAPVRRDFDTVNRLLSGAIPLFVSLDGGAPGAFREPEALRALERLQRDADAAPYVSRTLSLADTVRVMNRALEQDDPAAERIPDTRSAAAELLFLAPKAHLSRFTNVDHSRTNLWVRTGAVGSEALREVEAALDAGLAAARFPDGVHGAVTGNALLLARSADGIAESQPQTVGLAALVIFALVWGSLRSLKLGVVAMIPNLLPVIVYFGMLGAGMAPLSLPTSLIGSVALGITIDDTVHTLARYRDERRAGLSTEAALTETVRHVGRAVVVTGLMLALGFSVMGLSGFAKLQEFGWLSAATLAVCLVTDLLLTGALLVRSRA